MYFLQISLGLEVGAFWGLFIFYHLLLLRLSLHLVFGWLIFRFCMHRGSGGCELIHFSFKLLRISSLIAYSSSKLLCIVWLSDYVWRM